MLSYQESLDFIHSIARFGSKPGLRRVKMLLERMGNPQNRLKFIHVAGTDGKGSTCTMLSHIYARAGYCVGLYISPYVIDFRERIQLNNEMIPPDELARSVTTVKAYWDTLDAIGETPTEFEVVVAVAMDYFTRMGCDIVILEVGMGGRFDATNVIGTPVCSVITHISLDHMEYLGDTIEMIAIEKCGIIKPGGVTVAYSDQEPEALAVIMERCAGDGNELRMGHRAEILSADITSSNFSYDSEEYRIPLAGTHQALNAVTVIEAVKASALRGFPVRQEHIAEGMAAARFPARVELLRAEPPVLLDGGHNPAEAKALAAALGLLGGRKIHAVMGMLADKDVDACLASVLPLCSSLTAITPDYPRAMSASELAAVARRYCSDVTVAEGGRREMLTAALERCGNSDALVCCGSLYLSAELRPMLLDLLHEV